MARDQGPVRDEEFAAAKQLLDELRDRARKDLAEDLGGNPEDYNADTDHADEPVTDSSGE